MLQQHSAFSPPSSGLILVICHAVGVTLKVCLGVWWSGSGYKGEIPQMVGKKTKKTNKNTDGRICCGAKVLFFFFFFFLKEKAKLFSFDFPPVLLWTDTGLVSPLLCSDCMWMLERGRVCVLCCSAIDCMKPECVGVCLCVCVCVCVCVSARVCVDSGVLAVTASYGHLLWINKCSIQTASLCVMMWTWCFPSSSRGQHMTELQQSAVSGGHLHSPLTLTLSLSQVFSFYLAV